MTLHPYFTFNTVSFLWTVCLSHPLNRKLPLSQECVSSEPFHTHVLRSSCGPGICAMSWAKQTGFRLACFSRDTDKQWQHGVITIVTGKTGSWEDIQSRFIGEGWILKGLSKRSPKGWVEFSLGKGPGGWPGHTAEGTVCLRGWRNRVHVIESPGCLGGCRGLEEAHPVEQPGALPLGHPSGLKCAFACWFGWLLFKFSASVPPARGLVSALLAFSCAAIKLRFRSLARLPVLLHSPSVL